MSIFVPVDTTCSLNVTVGTVGGLQEQTDSCGGPANSTEFPRLVIRLKDYSYYVEATATSGTGTAQAIGKFEYSLNSGGSWTGFPGLSWDTGVVSADDLVIFGESNQRFDYAVPVPATPNTVRVRVYLWIEVTTGTAGKYGQVTIEVADWDVYVYDSLGFLGEV